MQLDHQSEKRFKGFKPMTTKIRRRYIYLILALAFVIRIAYAVVTPPFQAPDEYSHYSYVRFIHESRQLPVQPSPAVRPEELEFHQPPLYYLLAAPLFGATEWIYGRQLLALRFINILFSMLTILIVYYFASNLWGHKPFTVGLICTTVALLPTYTYLSATMRNGTLAAFFASLGFYLCAKLTLNERRQRDVRWSWVGVVAGLAILSNLSALAFGGACGLMLVIAERNWRISLQRAGWFGLGFMSTAGWWFLRNWYVYGHPLKIIENGWGVVPPPVSWEHETRSAIVVFKTFWAVFGRINEFHYADIYRFYWWFFGLSLLGIIVYVLRKREELPLKLVGFFAMAIAFSLVTTLYYAHNYDSDQGRYMFPSLLPIATFIAIGLTTLFPEKYHRWVLDIVLFAFAGINVVVLARLAANYWQI
jgi:hypothetical protein